MNLFVSFDGDHIGQKVGRASLADDVEGIAKIAQSIDRGNSIWRSWAESHGGRAINTGGDEGRLEVPATALSEIPSLREQYESATGATVSVGIGTKLSEADKSVMAAKAQGGDRVVFYSEEVDDILSQLKPKEEGAKLYDEYIKKSDGPAMNRGPGAGFSGHHKTHPAQPKFQDKEHSEAEVARGIYGMDNDADTPNYEERFHRAAAAQEAMPESNGQPTGLQDDVRGKIVEVLQNVRQKAPELEKMKASNPELYESVKNIVQAMIAMAQGLKKSEGEDDIEDFEDLEKTRPGPKFPKLGAPDDRAETDYITTQRQKRIKQRSIGFKARQAQGATEGHDNVLSPDAKPPREGDIHEKMVNKVHLKALGLASMGQSYARAGKLTPKNRNPDKLLGTKLHEDVHNMFARVSGQDPARLEGEYRKYNNAYHHSFYLKNNLARNLVNYAYSKMTPEAQKHYKELGGKPIVGKPEEAIAHAVSWLNGGFKGTSVPLEHKQAARDFYNHIIHASKHADKSWLSDKPSPIPDRKMEKSEVLEKDLMPGGRGDDKPDSDFDAEQLNAGIQREMEEHGLDEARAKEVAKDHLSEDPHYYSMEKAALKAGKTGRHQVVLPVGSQIDSGPSANHEAGEIKVRDPETGKTKWRQVRSGMVMSPDGTPTSSRNPNG